MSETSRPGRVVILGATYTDAMLWGHNFEAPFPDLEDAVPVSASAPNSVYGMAVCRAYVAPGAHMGPHYGKSLSETRRNLMKTPGSDDDVIYLEVP